MVLTLLHLEEKSAADRKRGPDPPVRQSTPKEEAPPFFRKSSRTWFKGVGEATPYFKEHPEAVPGIFKKFDTDGNGALSLEEFRAFADRRAPGAAPAAKPEPEPEPPKPSAAVITPPTVEGIAFFEKNIRPVLADKCYKCHSADAEKIKGGLVLDTRDGIRAATNEFFDRFPADAGTDETKRRELFTNALNAFCQAIFSSAEFRTLN